MTEFVWPAVVLTLGVLAFIRTRPRSKFDVEGAIADANGRIDTINSALTEAMDTLRKRFDENEKNPANLKAVVDRANALSNDMKAAKGDLNTVKARMLQLEEGWRTTETSMTSLKNQIAMKRMASGQPPP